MESYIASEGSHSGSSSDMAGLNDPIIAMPPVTTITPVAPVTTKAPISPIPITSSPASPSAPFMPTVGTPPGSPSAPPMPIVGTLPSTCANGQVPSNGHATLTGNGTVRVPPEGMEDAPQATDFPPV